MTHHPSRKHFLFRLAGIAAVAGVFPKLFAKTNAAVKRKPGQSAPSATPAIRVDPRAVARRADTI